MKLNIAVVLIVLGGAVRCEGYYGQFGQDQFLNERVFKGKKSGVFVDIGASDGISINNTYFFEQELGWNGICIEPRPEAFKKLQQNRSCICIEGCAGNFEGNTEFMDIHGYAAELSGIIQKYNPQHVQRIDLECARYGGEKKIITVPVYDLSKILKMHNISHIDYLSIDTEGGEFEIIKSLDFTACDIDIIGVEDNYGSKELVNYLEAQGFVVIQKLGVDLIFRNSKYINEKR